MVVMVDVFEGNGTVDWGRVRAAGVSAAIHKATQYRVDQMFSQHHSGIPAADLHHGCYHFMAYDVAPATQVRLYTSTIGTPDCFGWVIDFERYQGMLPTVAQLATLLSLLPPGPVLLYGNAGDLATLGTTFVGKVHVWLAAYGVNDGKPHGDPAAVRASTQFPPSDVILWQYTSKGRVDGISGDVDMSMWLGTDAEWAAYAGGSGQVHVQSVAQSQTEEETMPMLAATDPKNGCHALCDRDTGAVYCYNPDWTPGGHYLGGANRAGWNVGTGQANGPVVAFEFFDDGNAGWSAYAVMTQGADGKPRSYSFPSSGVLAK